MVVGSNPTQSTTIYFYTTAKTEFLQSVKGSKGKQEREKKRRKFSIYTDTYAIPTKATEVHKAPHAIWIELVYLNKNVLLQKTRKKKRERYIQMYTHTCVGICVLTLPVLFLSSLLDGTHSGTHRHLAQKDGTTVVQNH